MSDIFKWNYKDFAKGIVVSVFSAIITYFYQLISAPNGYDLFATDWNGVLKVAIVAGVGYLAKNLFTDSQGKFGGVL